jgi:hypothetical protein
MGAALGSGNSLVGAGGVSDGDQRVGRLTLEVCVPFRCLTASGSEVES